MTLPSATFALFHQLKIDSITCRRIVLQYWNITNALHTLWTIKTANLQQARLIDEEIDPLENNNLVESAAHQEQMQVLNAELSSWMTETADDFDLEMPWPPKNFVSHKDADRLLKTDVHSRAILVP